MSIADAYKRRNRAIGRAAAYSRRAYSEPELVTNARREAEAARIEIHILEALSEHDLTLEQREHLAALLLDGAK